MTAYTAAELFAAFADANGQAPADAQRRWNSFTAERQTQILLAFNRPSVILAVTADRFCGWLAICGAGR